MTFEDRDCLVRLTSFLQRGVINTNQTRENYDSATDRIWRLLKVWTISETVTSDVNDDNSDSGDSVNAEIHSTVQDIDTVVGQAKKLRAQFQIINKKHKSLEIQNSCISAVSSTNKTPLMNSKARKITLPREKFYRRTKSNLTQRNTGVSNKAVQVNKHESVCTICSTYQNDFSTRPSSSNKSNSGSSKKSKSNYRCVNLPTITLNETTLTKSGNMIDVDYLLSRVTLNPTKNVQTRQCNSLSRNYNLLQNKPNTKKRLVCLEEAITFYEMPVNLLHSFKLYQQFITKTVFPEKDSYHKNAPAKHFVTLLSHHNKNRWLNNSCEPSVALFSDYLKLSTLLKIQSNTLSCPESNCKLVLCELEALDKKLLRLSDKCDSTLCKIMLRKNVTNNNRIMKRSSLTFLGMWHHQQNNLFKGLLKMPCIFYKNAEQLQQLLFTIQKIQEIQFQIDILEILKCDIIPKLQQLNTGTMEFMQYFKVIACLTDILSLSLPTIQQSCSC